jgi:hypothetical protein
MNQPLVEKPESPDRSAPFTEMARALVHNKGQGFGGAVVIVPPDNGGESIELLLLDSRGDPAQFWATVKSRLELRLREIDDRRNSLAGNFGGR